MIKILLVSQKRGVFRELEAQFLSNQTTIQWIDSGQSAIGLITEKKFDLFIISEEIKDMTGRQLIEKALFQNAMMNSVVLSDTPHKDFHEVYEGMGVLMQLPLKPAKSDAAKILDHIARIVQINE